MLLRAATSLASSVAKVSHHRLAVSSRVASSTSASAVSFPAFAEAIRFHSTSAADASITADDNNNDTASLPKLKKIPALPFVGSNFPFSGIDPMWPSIQAGDITRYWRKLHKENGPFYKIGMPGLGQGVFGTMYVVRSPDEMLKVIRAEGKFPGGLVENIWPTIAWMKERNFSSIGLFRRGEEWKRIRSFLQKDLLAPQSAREYMPSIVEATKHSSERLAHDPNMMKDLNLFLNYCSADMFLYAMFGGGASSEADQKDYDDFVLHAVETLGSINDLMLSPKEMVAGIVGFKTPKLRKFFDLNDLTSSEASVRVREFMDRKSKGTLTETEKNCYLYKMLERQPETDITEKELLEICYFMMSAAVDTTAAKTAWNLMQLALHPDCQASLREQLEQAVKENGTGELTAKIFDDNQVPLLSAFIRETYRCTPPTVASLMKPIQQPVEVYATTIPAGSSIMFDGLTNMMDPELVDDPMTFKPERWLKSAVEARKNTPQAIIDHPFYSGPFSQGARRCPGSRVAYLEIQAILARLLLDYDIQGPSSSSNMHWNDVKAELHLMAVPVFPEEVKLVPRA